MQKLVEEFHKKYNLSINLNNLGLLEKDDISVREKLIQEETQEVLNALVDLGEILNNSDASIDERRLAHADFLKELCDLVYVVLGTAVAFGYNFEDAFKAVHESNMTKNGGTSNEGKLTKGSAYVKPDIFPYIFQE